MGLPPKWKVGLEMNCGLVAMAMLARSSMVEPALVWALFGGPRYWVADDLAFERRAVGFESGSCLGDRCFAPRCARPSASR